MSRWHPVPMARTQQRELRAEKPGSSLDPKLTDRPVSDKVCVTRTCNANSIITITTIIINIISSNGCM